MHWIQFLPLSHSLHVSFILSPCVSHSLGANGSLFMSLFLSEYTFISFPSFFNSWSPESKVALEKSKHLKKGEKKGFSDMKNGLPTDHFFPYFLSVRYSCHSSLFPFSTLSLSLSLAIFSSFSFIHSILLVPYLRRNVYEIKWIRCSVLCSCYFRTRRLLPFV